MCLHGEYSYAGSREERSFAVQAVESGKDKDDVLVQRHQNGGKGAQPLALAYLQLQPNLLVASPPLP